MEIKPYLKEQAAIVDAALDGYLPAEAVAPSTLHKALRHSMFAGGKRLRPILALAAADVCGGDCDNTLPQACAVECIHTYSLIHDDLPCMDDDDFRRGHPTCHKVFGDGIAVLAGDAMQALAFELSAKSAPSGSFTAADYITELAVTCGSLKLIAGQVMDVEGEGKKLGIDELRRIHECKTAALLTTSIRLGAMSAGASDAHLAALTEFGYALGLAFQVIDDILDVTQTSEVLGKSAGKDEAVDKATYPAVLGLEASRTEAARLTAAAHAALETFGDGATTLAAIADYLLDREY